MEGQFEGQHALDALKNATVLTIPFVVNKLASDEQCKQIAASLRAAVDHLEDTASHGDVWPCDVSLVREVADILDGIAAPSWVPEVIRGGRAANMTPSRDD